MLVTAIEEVERKQFYSDLSGFITSDQPYPALHSFPLSKVYLWSEKSELYLLYLSVTFCPAHMGQILQDGENVCFMSNFF